MTAQADPDRKLALGLLVDSLEVPAWGRSALERLRRRGAAVELVLLVAPGATPGAARVHSLYAALDERLNRVSPDALALVTIRDLVEDVPVHTASTSRDRGGGDRFTSEAVAAVRERGLDLILDLRGAPLAGEILESARLGVWSWRCGDGRSHGGPDGLWPLARRSPITEVTLVVAGENGAARTVLSRSQIATDPSSVRRNRNKLYWKLAAMTVRTVARVRSASGEELVHASCAGEARARHAGDPSTAVTAALLVRTALRRAYHEVRRRLFVDRWTILYSLAPSDALDLSRFQELRPPADRAWADPHLWERDGKVHLFLEEISYPSGRGHLAVSTLDGRRWSTPTTVLEAPYHLSNPFLFEHQGALYLIPESAAHHTIDLYRCDRFPDRWKHVKVLMDGVRAVDTCVLHHQGRWWMFVNIADGPGSSTYDELYLFHAVDPVTGDWTPHPSNPVVADVRHARPAGPMFVRGGALIRPAQDCSRRYGYAVRFMRVDRLDEQGYAETEVGALVPPRLGPYLGVHTFGKAGTVTVIDALRPRLRSR